MKKLLVLAAVFALVLAACGDGGGELPSLTIRNQSAYVLTNVTFNNIVFSAAGSSDLSSTSESTKQLRADDLNKAGYITFTRKDIGIACRIASPISITDEDYTFTFSDSTVVEELGNSANKNTLSAISFLPKINVEKGGTAIHKNEQVHWGTVVIDTDKETEFVIRNAGTGKLVLAETEAITITDDTDGVFSLVQPSSSEIAQNETVTFKVSFGPKAEKTYTATVTISSDDPDGGFVFTITGTGVLLEPIINIFFDDAEVSQNGTIDAGSVYITQSEDIIVLIHNTGTKDLEIDTANITVIGTDADAFTITDPPDNLVSPNGQTQFTVRCAPIKEDINSATLTIPSNDNSRNPATVILNVTGVKMSAIVQLGQGSIVIDTSSGINLGRVEMGEFASFTLFIKNIGNIDLKLTGDPPVTSSNAAFTVSRQPAITTIVPDDSVTFQLTFTPDSEEEFNGTITISNNTDEGAFVFDVMGMGFSQ